MDDVTKLYIPLKVCPTKSEFVSVLRKKLTADSRNLISRQMLTVGQETWLV